MRALKPWEYINRDGKAVPCAWCQRDQGIMPRAGESHGICTMHQRAVLAEAGIGLVRGDDGTVRPVPLADADREGK